MLMMEGTLISTLILGTGLWSLSTLGLLGSTRISLVDCFMTGSLLSSTDPISMVAVFSQLGVDPKLLAILMGESMLNDSVSIILFATLSRVRGAEAVTTRGLIQGAAVFLSGLGGSTLLGILPGLACSLLLKHSRLHAHPTLETCIVFLVAYFSYVSSSALSLSGIVSLLFCAITLKHYANNVLSLRSRRAVKYMSRVLCQLSEQFIFLYLGISLFASEEHYHVGLIAWTLVLVLVARYAGVVGVARLVNAVYRRAASPGLGRAGRAEGAASVRSLLSESPSKGPMYDAHSAGAEGGEEAIPRNYQLMLWWAGLRGAVAFALSFEMRGEAAPFIRTTTLIVCVVSVLVMGGTSTFALQYLQIPTRDAGQLSIALPLGGAGASDLGSAGDQASQKAASKFEEEADEATDSSVDTVAGESEGAWGRDVAGTVGSPPYHRRSPSPVDWENGKRGFWSTAPSTDLGTHVCNREEADQPFAGGLFHFTHLPARPPLDTESSRPLPSPQPSLRRAKSSQLHASSGSITGWFLTWDATVLRPFFSRARAPKRSDKRARPHPRMTGHGQQREDGWQWPSSSTNPAASTLASSTSTFADGS